MQLHSVDWFYCAVKKKFRRHGGAKVLKELYKRKKQGNLDLLFFGSKSIEDLLNLLTGAHRTY